MRFAITSPTGKIGGKLVRELLNKGGHELVLLCRDSKKVADAVSRGARVVEGRLEDADYFARATDKVDALFLVLPIDSRAKTAFDDCKRITDSATAAIRKNKINRVVFVSSIGAHLDKGTGPIRVLREAEQKLREAAPNLTVLRPTFYMDQLMGWMDSIAKDGAFYQPVSATRMIPMVAASDVARFALDVLTDASWTGHRTLPLHGPQEYSYTQVADTLSRTLGSKVRYVEEPPAKVGERLRGRGWSDPAVTRNLEMLETLDKGGLTDEFPRSKWNVRRTTLEEFAKNEFRPAFDRRAAVTA